MSKYDVLIKCAAAEIGYTESPANSNNNKYGVWYGMNKQPWCMIFVQYCHNAIGCRLPYRTASCSDLLKWYRKNRPGDVHNSPKPGYIAIFDFGHTGIVERVNTGSITCIEGNTSSDVAGSQSNGGGVFRRTRQMGQVVAFIDGISIKEEETKPMTKKDVLTALGDEYIENYDQLPSWAKADIRELLDKGIINGGTSIKDNPDDINMFLSDIKTIIAVKRMIGK